VSDEEDIKDLRNFFALSFELASFPNLPNIIDTVLRAFTPPLPRCSGSTRAMCMRCGRRSRPWKTGGMGDSSRLKARWSASGR
jgi:hypothetical protein